MNDMRRILEDHAESGYKLCLESFVSDRTESRDEEPVENMYTLVRGGPESLRFLGELLIEFADGDHGDTFEIHPQGAGSTHFDPRTRLGIYLIKEPRH